jgi:chemotaxis protein methyltransferase CheR
MNKYVLDASLITNDAYDKIRAIIYKRYGIYLSAHKQEFLKSRLSKILRRLNLSNYDEYLLYLNRLPVNDAHWSDFIDAISTNVTYFLRENFQLDILKQKVLPKMHDQNQINIWSAGCSNGSEPYTLKILLREYFEKLGKISTKIQIHGTDISKSMINEAVRGVYDQKMLGELDPLLINKYFKQGINEMTGKYRVKEIIKEDVFFSIYNLMDMPYNFNKSFDIIFCRNVLIYFDKQTVEDIVTNFFKVLKPGGFLFLGSSESLNTMSKKNVGPSIYINE